MDELEVARHTLGELNPYHYEVYLEDRWLSLFHKSETVSPKHPERQNSHATLCAVRLSHEGRTGEAVVHSHSPDAIEACIRQAMRAAETQPSPSPGHDSFFSFGSTLYQETDSYDAAGRALPAAVKREVLDEMENHCLATDSSITRVTHAEVKETHTRVRMLSSEGEKISEQGSLYEASVTCEARGSIERGRAQAFSRFFDTFRAEKAPLAGRLAAFRAMEMIDARPGQDFRGPAILRNDAMAQLLEHFAPHFQAGRIGRGRKLASENVTIIHDGLLPGGYGTRSFDAEGCPTTRTPLVEGGILVDELHTTASARRGQRLSNGCAVRDAFGTLKAGVQNLYLAHGRQDFAQLLRGISRGFLVTRLWDFQPVAGGASDQFTARAQGMWISDGCLLRPTGQLRLETSFRELASQITEVGSDLQFHGAYGAPSVQLIELSLTGA
ncbi:MAG: TldD/PmbA family protein [Bacteriovoracia bacterium]